MKYFSGKDYPWLCSKCRGEMDSVIQLMPELPDDESGDQEAPCTFIYDHAMMCHGHSCWDSDFKDWSVREVWEIVDVLKEQGQYAAIKITRKNNPNIGLRLAENFVRELKAEIRFDNEHKS